MAANTRPIYSVAPSIQWTTGPITAANTTTDMISGAVHRIFTASSSEGGRVDRIIIQPLGSNSATVLRLWVNDGTATTNSGANTQIRDITLPLTTVSQTAAVGSVECQLDLPLNPSYALYATIGTSVAAGFLITAVGGRY